MRTCIALLLLSTMCAWAASGPFDPKWDKAVVIWDFRKNDLMCHGNKAQLVGEEEPTITVGTDAQGHAVKRRFRLLTYNCESRKHVIRIWMDQGLDLVREVKCHEVTALDKYDDKEKGMVVICPEGEHKILLQGSEKQ